MQCNANERMLRPPPLPLQVPWDDLRYIFGEILYGGHIVEDWDRRLSAAYLVKWVFEQEGGGQGGSAMCLRAVLRACPSHGHPPCTPPVLVLCCAQVLQRDAHGGL